MNKNRESLTSSLWKTSMIEQINKLKGVKQNSIQGDVIVQTLKLYKHIKNKEEKQQQQETNLSENSSDYSQDSQDEEFQSTYNIWEESQASMNGYYEIDDMSLLKLYNLRSLCCDDWVSDQTALDNFFLIAKLAEDFKKSNDHQPKKQKRANHPCNKRNGVFSSQQKISAQDDICSQFKAEELKVIRDHDQSVTFKKFKRYQSEYIFQEKLKLRDHNYCRYNNPKKSQNSFADKCQTAEVIKKKFLIEQLKADDKFKKEKKFVLMENRVSNQNLIFSEVQRTEICKSNPFENLLAKTNQFKEDESFDTYFNESPQLDSQSKSNSTQINKNPYQNSPLRAQFRKLHLQQSISVQTQQSIPVQAQQSIQALPSSSQILKANISPSKSRHLSLSNQVASSGELKRKQSVGRSQTNIPFSLSQIPNDLEEENSTTNEQQEENYQFLASRTSKSLALRSYADFQSTSRNSNINMNQSKQQLSSQRGNSSEQNFWIKSPENNFQNTPHLKYILNREKISSVNPLFEIAKSTQFTPSKSFSPKRRPPIGSLVINSLEQVNLPSFLPKIHSVSNISRNSQSNQLEPKQMNKINLFQVEKKSQQLSEYSTAPSLSLASQM